VLQDDQARLKREAAMAAMNRVMLVRPVMVASLALAGTEVVAAADEVATEDLVAEAVADIEAVTGETMLDDMAAGAEAVALMKLARAEETLSKGFEEAELATAVEVSAVTKLESAEDALSKAELIEALELRV
jgi:hypothetical protein